MSASRILPPLPSARGIRMQLANSSTKPWTRRARVFANRKRVVLREARRAHQVVLVGMAIKRS